MKKIPRSPKLLQSAKDTTKALTSAIGFVKNSKDAGKKLRKKLWTEDGLIGNMISPSKKSAIKGSQQFLKKLLSSKVIFSKLGNFNLSFLF